MTNRIYLQALALILRDAVPHHTKESALLAKMLIYVALHPGCCVRELAQEFSVDQATVSRVTRNLRLGKVRGKKRRSSKKGLIRCCDNRAKRHTYELTDTGERFVSRLARRIPTAAQKVLMADV